MIDTFRRERVFGFLRRLLNEGREKGFVRNELNQEELIFLLAGFINQVLVPERILDAGFSLQQVFSTLIELLYGGILTMVLLSGCNGQRNTGWTEMGP